VFSINTYPVILNHLDLLRDIFKLTYGGYRKRDYKWKLFHGRLSYFPSPQELHYHLPPSDLKQELFLRWHSIIVSRVSKAPKVSLRRELLNSSIIYVTGQINFIPKHSQHLNLYSNQYIDLSLSNLYSENISLSEGLSESWGSCNMQVDCKFGVGKFNGTGISLDTIFRTYDVREVFLTHQALWQLLHSLS
jgi:hypothetical protein